MATVGSIEYKVISGTVGAIATFNAAVEADINNGYAPLGEPITDGTDIFQTMFKGSAASFVAEYAIDAATDGAPGAGVLEVVGDITIDFNPGYKFTVTRSTGNDGVYTVLTSEYVGPNTEITVKEALPDNTPDGFIEGWSPSVGP